MSATRRRRFEALKSVSHAGRIYEPGEIITEAEQEPDGGELRTSHGRAMVRRFRDPTGRQWEVRSPQFGTPVARLAPRTPDYDRMIERGLVREISSVKEA